MSTTVILRFSATRFELVNGRPIDRLSEAMLTAANARGIMASGNAGALRLAAGSAIERELQAQAPLLVGNAYLTGAGRLAGRGVTHIAHAVVNAVPGEPPKRAAVERALTHALALLDGAGTRALTLADIGARVPNLGVDESAAMLIERVVARLRQGGGFETMHIASLEPAYLSACVSALLSRGALRA